MSLLLDALKRAEDAKRAKAEAAASSQSDQPASDDAGSPSPPSEAAPSIATNLAAPGSDAPDVPLLSHEVDDDRTGEPVGASSLDLLAAEVSPPVTAPAKTAALSLEEMLDNELGYTDRKKVDPPPTPAATAAFRAARLQNNPPPPPSPAAGPYSPSFSAPPSLLELEGTSALAEPPAPPQDLEQNREAIKNAFAVKQAAKPQSKAKWIIPVIGLLVAVVGAGGWYVWNEMNRFNKPMVAFTPRPAQPVAPAPTSATPATQPAAPSAAAAKPADPATTEKTTVAHAEDAPAPLPPLLPPPATQLRDERKPVVQKVMPATPREAIARRVDSLPALSGLEIGADRVVLKPSSVVAPTVSPAITAGYAALSTGDYSTAKRRYAEAIAANNNSVDAHLGFATAAARTGDATDLALAIKHYQRVLELDPRNSTASAALILLSGGRAGGTNAANSSSEREAELRALVTQDPTSANAHYLLGNFYVEQRRWREAQQAFFEAARLAPQVADYSYNLAVSLDNLGQASSAANFYRRALAATTKGQFDAAAVARRITQLTETTKEGASSR